MTATSSDDSSLNSQRSAGTSARLDRRSSAPPLDTSGIPAIVTNELNLWYGSFQALKNVTTTIKRGHITSLIGPSGCGKTTLLRCFNRVNERYGYVTTNGEIRVLGKNIYDTDIALPELRKSVGMVFQRPNPLPVSEMDRTIDSSSTRAASVSSPPSGMASTAF